LVERTCEAARVLRCAGFVLLVHRLTRRKDTDCVSVR
jgi:hypothetical protein